MTADQQPNGTSRASTDPWLNAELARINRKEMSPYQRQWMTADAIHMADFRKVCEATGDSRFNTWHPAHGDCPGQPGGEDY